MVISILTLFPEMFDGPFAHSIVRHAQEKKFVTIRFINIRDFGMGKHRMVDDTPYGGGIGMVMRVDVLHAAIEHTKKDVAAKKTGVVLLTASGRQFTQQNAQVYSTFDHLILICGHYEGVDARIAAFVDEEVSIGDFITTGGEIPAMLITDAVTRLIPGVLKEGATEAESFSLRTAAGSEMLVEYPHYTHPREYEGQAVPEVLLSGDHKKIDAWRLSEAEKRTKILRPDLLTAPDETGQNGNA